jgi:GTP1/Obg family GTP-binding protein
MKQFYNDSDNIVSRIERLKTAYSRVQEEDYEKIEKEYISTFKKLSKEEQEKIKDLCENHLREGLMQNHNGDFVDFRK